MVIKREMGAILPVTSMTSPIYINVKDGPFDIYGLLDDYSRVPEDIAKKIGDDFYHCSKSTAGGRIRFKTNTKKLTLHIDREELRGEPLNFIADVYKFVDGKRIISDAFCPTEINGGVEVNGIIEGRLTLKGEMTEYEINLPLLTTAKNIYLGFDEDAIVEHGSKYTHEKPVVFYGSSIVNGVGSSRPGTSYPAIISRNYDVDYINLGFSGLAHAEEELMEYIAGLDMSVFVYDYDYNATSTEFLSQTHYRGYEIIREKNPTLPIIFASKVDYLHPTMDVEGRRTVIEKSYKKAVSNGDKNVFFIDGRTIIPREYYDECFYDGIHPNDLGYLYMSKAFGHIISRFI